MGTIGFGEVLFLALLGLLLFGPEKLPEMARGLGRVVGRVREEATGTLDELRRSADVDELRGVAGDLGRASDELRRAGADLTAAPGQRRAAPADSATGNGARGAGAPPYDPEAT